MEDILLKHDVSIESYSRKEMIRFMMNNLMDAALLCKCEINGILSITDSNSIACRFLGFDYTELRQKASHPNPTYVPDVPSPCPH